MKVRFGFVSNSSTSSFVVYGTFISEDKLDKLCRELLKEKCRPVLDDEYATMLPENPESARYDNMDDLCEETGFEIIYNGEVRWECSVRMEGLLEKNNVCIGAGITGIDSRH